MDAQNTNKKPDEADETEQTVTIPGGEEEEADPGNPDFASGFDQADEPPPADAPGPKAKSAKAAKAEAKKAALVAAVVTEPESEPEPEPSEETVEPDSAEEEDAEEQEDGSTTEQPEPEKPAPTPAPSAAAKAEKEYERQMAERGTPVVKTPEPAPVKAEPQKPAPSEADAPSDTITLPAKFKVGDVEVDLAEVERDFPEAAAYAKAIHAAASSEIARQRMELDVLRKHVLAQQQQSELAEFRRSIEAKHPGAIELIRTEPFVTWMKEQKESVQFLFAQGGEPGADAVLELYDVHKARAAAAKHDSKTATKLERQAKLHSGTTTTGQTVKAGRTRKPQEDFDDGFDRAASEK